MLEFNINMSLIFDFPLGPDHQKVEYETFEKFQEKFMKPTLKEMNIKGDVTMKDSKLYFDNMPVGFVRSLEAA